eukprot:TRINITY_DN1108_c0_g1_i12.p1 TRINITY_DN1108_c0_g1~~TRINITY_DN1108_c0_g1_i12.p1  ORF type:complete len:106 (-),score=9.30 TRINITY_DN1108_c0_g1_i12:158-475(-)
MAPVEISGPEPWESILVKTAPFCRSGGEGGTGGDEAEGHAVGKQFWRHAEGTQRFNLLSVHLPPTQLHSQSCTYPPILPHSLEQNNLHLDAIAIGASLKVGVVLE